MAIVIYNDNGTIKVVKFGNYVVSTDADPIDTYEIYEISYTEYNSYYHKLDVTVSDHDAELIMSQFAIQHPATYNSMMSGQLHLGDYAIRADDGHGNTFWAFRLK